MRLEKSLVIAMLWSQGMECPLKIADTADDSYVVKRRRGHTRRMEHQHDASPVRATLGTITSEGNVRQRGFRHAPRRSGDPFADARGQRR